MPACLLLVMLLGQSAGIGCATTTATAVTDTYCAAAAPIRWSAGDSDETILQIKRHNAVWTRLCGAGADAPLAFASGTALPVLPR